VADRIYLADKPTLDLVKQDTNMLLSKGSFDLSKYAVMQDNITILSDTTAIGKSLVIKEVKGAGFLADCIMANTVSEAGYLQITVDDIIILKTGMILGGGNGNGLFKASNLFIANSTLFCIECSQKKPSQIIGDFASTYGDLSSSPEVVKNLLISENIYFNKNLKVEFISNNATSKTIWTTIRGGVKIA
jgi:hypothetical protein